ncbi:uncharacterized protein LOC122257373 isoform X1 [Penaeus japonicus]|uniref:uncharacterized protein LOC122257373 isoform X1 n=1 Tax=Penaeus japonicus TaxID=27405 RepID=UPI001C70B1D6|nr:uncharacterized protein LOC122257373 isoform X1 [Penaeus japonicus]XP_042878567.1 uncharacterized protein LOC122257373 isoform X1 [Penaeus japonicus]
MMTWSVVGLLLAIALNVSARSVSPVDVPDPPKSASPTIERAAAPRGVKQLPAALAKIARPDPAPLTKKPTILDALDGSCKQACKLGLSRPGCVCSKDSPIELCKLACDLNGEPSGCECTVISRARPEGTNEVRVVISEKVIISVVRPRDNEEELTTVNPHTSVTVKTTTMNPIDEFCKEACEEGIGGPECDCADHPIG